MGRSVDFHSRTYSAVGNSQATPDILVQSTSDTPGTNRPITLHSSNAESSGNRTTKACEPVVARNWSGFNGGLLNDFSELLQDFREIGLQVLHDPGVVHELDQITPGQHQIEHVLAMGLLRHLVVSEQVAHLIFHTCRLFLGQSARQWLLLTCDEHLRRSSSEQRFGITFRHVVRRYHQLRALDLPGRLHAAQHRCQ
jgi:hypothetical protein